MKGIFSFIKYFKTNFNSTVIFWSSLITKYCDCDTHPLSLIFLKICFLSWIYLLKFCFYMMTILLDWVIPEIKLISFFVPEFSWSWVRQWFRFFKLCANSESSLKCPECLFNMWVSHEYILFSIRSWDIDDDGISSFYSIDHHVTKCGSGIPKALLEGPQSKSYFQNKIKNLFTS